MSEKSRSLMAIYAGIHVLWDNPTAAMGLSYKEF
ncbi:hypothetical protein SY94_0279 [Agrobacterium tumefaciens]|nr:hypothetical protein SY94_0279 [Agrobacterium tumefaciens]